MNDEAIEPTDLHTKESKQERRERRKKEALANGHSKCSPITAIRKRCVACSGGSHKEVEQCAVINCELWPFRFGENVWNAPRQLSDAQRKGLRERAKEMYTVKKSNALKMDEAA